MSYHNYQQVLSRLMQSFKNQGINLSEDQAKQLLESMDHRYYLNFKNEKNNSNNVFEIEFDPKIEIKNPDLQENLHELFVGITTIIFNKENYRQAGLFIDELVDKSTMSFFDNEQDLFSYTPKKEYDVCIFHPNLKVRSKTMQELNKIMGDLLSYCLKHRIILIYRLNIDDGYESVYHSISARSNMIIKVSGSNFSNVIEYEILKHRTKTGFFKGKKFKLTVEKLPDIDLDQPTNTLILSDEDFDQIEKAIENPAEPTERLKKAMKAHKEFFEKNNPDLANAANAGGGLPKGEMTIVLSGVNNSSFRKHEKCFALFHRLVLQSKDKNMVDIAIESRILKSWVNSFGITINVFESSPSLHMIFEKARDLNMLGRADYQLIGQIAGISEAIMYDIYKIHKQQFQKMYPQKQLHFSKINWNALNEMDEGIPDVLAMNPNYNKEESDEE